MTTTAASMMAILPQYGVDPVTPSRDDLAVLADWLLDTGCPGIAAMVRHSWLPHTWRAYQDDAREGAICVILEDGARFDAVCARLAGFGFGLAHVRLEIDRETNEVHTRAWLSYHDYSYGRSPVDLDTEKVVEAYLKEVEND